MGNILKFGRLYKILQAGNRLAGKTRTFTKVVTTVKGVAGVAEISSGSVNILLKLTGVADTDLGREISKYLFYFEMFALSGEVSIALYTKVQKSAAKILAKEKVLRESAENSDEAKLIDDVIEELRRVAGMAENIKTIKNADEFLASAKKLAKLNITEKNALEYLDEALQHFNHHVVDNIVVKIGDNNCVEVVKVVEEYLKTGKITKAKYSEFQDIAELRNIYGGTFFRYDRILSIKNVMKEGERGILYGDKGLNKKGHVFNVIKKDGELLLKDGQNGLNADLRPYISYQYLKTN